jgi:hypothetical protein
MPNIAVGQFPLSVNRGKPIAATNHRTGFQGEMQENYHLSIWMGFPLSFVCSGHPIVQYWISHIFWLKQLKPVFCNLKRKLFLKKKNKMSAVQCVRKTFQLIPLLTPVDSLWTKHFSNQKTTSAHRNLSLSDTWIFSIQ